MKIECRLRLVDIRIRYFNTGPSMPLEAKVEVHPLNKFINNPPTMLLAFPSEAIGDGLRHAIESAVEQNFRAVSDKAEAEVTKP